MAKLSSEQRVEQLEQKVELLEELVVTLLLGMAQEGITPAGFTKELFDQVQSGFFPSQTAKLSAVEVLRFRAGGH